MKVLLNVFLILAAGAAAFFSYSESQKFQDQQSIRIEKKTAESTVKANAVANEKEYKDEQSSLAESTRKKEEVASAINALKAAEASTKRDIAGLDTSLATQQQELADLGKAVDELNKQLQDTGGNVTIDNVGDEVAKLEENVKAKKARMEELTALIDGAQKKIASTQSESKRLSIGAGSNSGFTPQTSLLVKRDGKFIGRVKPTSIEATQTIADIEMESLAAGVRIQPGDRVIISTPATN